MTSVMRMSSAFNAQTKPTTGDVKMSFVNADHLGWLNCDGRELDTTKYNLLFQVIGYTFGRSGDNFRLPNLSGRVMGSAGTVLDDANLTNTFLPGDSLGEVDHKLVLSEIPSHNHDDNTPAVELSTLPGHTTTSTTGVYDSGHVHLYENESNDANPSNVQISTTSVATSSEIQHSTNTGYANIVDPGHKHSIASNGGDQYHNNMQPTLFYGNTFVYCGIPYNGVGTYPFTVGLTPVLL